MNVKYAFAACAILLSGCGGGGGGSAPGLPPPGVGPGPKPQSGNVAVTIKIPPRTGKSSVRRAQSSKVRGPQYISSATQGIDFSVTQNGASAGYTFAPLTPTSPGCSVIGGTLTCTVSFSVLPGADTITVNTYDQPNPNTGAILSTVTVTQTIAAGVNNVLNFVTSGVPESVSATVNAFCCGFGSSQNVAVNGVDADGFTITGPFDSAITLTTDDTTNGFTFTPPAISTAGNVTVQYIGNAATATSLFLGCSHLQTQTCVFGGPLMTVNVPSETLYVESEAGGPAVAFTNNANGNVAPLRTLCCGGSGVAVDGRGRAYIDFIGSSPATDGIVSYTPGASDSSPQAEHTNQTLVQGAATGMNAPWDIAVDASGTAYVANAYRVVGGQSSDMITEYAPGANGNVAPIRTIAGSATGLSEPLGITVDFNNEAFAANFGNNSVTEYGNGANGNVAPIATIAGAATGILSPVAVALDSVGNIYVANVGGGNILVFPRGSNGNVTPSQNIVGSATGLNKPSGVAIDSGGNICVSNAGSNSITVYASGATGNVAPIRTIVGPATLLNTPGRIRFSPSAG